MMIIIVQNYINLDAIIKKYYIESNTGDHITLKFSLHYRFRYRILDKTIYYSFFKFNKNLFNKKYSENDLDNSYI